MTDLSTSTAGLVQTPPWRLLWESAQVFVRFGRLLWQVYWADKRSITAILTTGESVSLVQGFTTDGTTFVVALSDGSLRRVPASLIKCIEDKGDWGYV